MACVLSINRTMLGSAGRYANSYKQRHGNRPLIWRDEWLMPYGTDACIKRKDCVIPHQYYRYMRSFLYFAGLFGEFALTARLCENFASEISQLLSYRSRVVICKPISILIGNIGESPILPLNGHHVRYTESITFSAFISYLWISRLI